MKEQIIIRFRDLVTELGGTIEDHRAILRSFGEVWWGWFMQPYETPPRVLFGQMLEHIQQSGPIRSLLFDSGQGKFYSCIIAGIKVAPTQRGISSPDPERSPEYYHRGRYQAWFMLRAIEEREFKSLSICYKGFPTRPEQAGMLEQLINCQVESPTHMRDTKVTLWLVECGGNETGT